jgi:carbonic anhydrase
MTDIDRRTLLRRAGVCVAGIAAGLAAPSMLAAKAGKSSPPWSYEGPTGPRHWGNLDSDWRACSNGAQQSPIDLPSNRPAFPAGASVRLQYAPRSLSVVHTGKGFKFLPGEGNRALVDGAEYRLVQFHEHTPSEHTVGGRAYPAELHFVHADDDGRLAVVGIFLRQSSRPGPVDELLRALPDDVNERRKVAESFDLSRLFPRDLVAYRYPGSLTTPDCREGVKWTVLPTPVAVSAAGLEALRRTGPNSRPVQPLRGRSITSARVAV